MRKFSKQGVVGTVLVFIIGVTILGCKTKDMNNRTDENIYWPFVGCCNKSEFVERYDSLCVTLRDQLAKKEVLQSDSEIKKIVQEFEPETDSIILFLNSKKELSFASVYGRYNMFYGLETKYGKYMFAPSQYEIDDKEKISEMLNLFKGDSATNKKSYFNVLQEMQTYKKVIVIREKSPFKKPKGALGKVDGDHQYSSGWANWSPVFNIKDDHTSISNTYFKWLKSK